MEFKTQVLTIDDLELRPVSIEDTQSFSSLLTANYEYLAEWMDLPPLISNSDDIPEAMQRELRERGENHSHWWMIWLADLPVGTISLTLNDSKSVSGEIGYWLDQSRTGHGYATRSVRRVIDWAFENLGLLRVEFRVAVSNIMSCAVPERLCIRRESIRRQSEVINGVSLDMASYAAFADNWPPKPPLRALPAIEIRVDDDILLRQHVGSDYDSMWDAFTAGRDYLGEFLPWMAAYKTKDDYTRLYTARRLENDNFDGSRGYVVEYKGELAGTVGFGIPNRDNVIEVGYWLRKDLQGQGIMTQSVEAVITMLFVEVGMHRVTIRAATANLPSRGIPERLGFKHEGTMRDGGFVNDEYLDLEIYSMLDHEWLARSTNA